MALMKYREPNMVKWVGVRSGHNGEQVLEYGGVVGVGTTVLYTVPAGKTLHLSYIQLGSEESVGAVGYAYLTVYDATPVNWKRLIAHRYTLAGLQSTGGGLPFPIEIPATYTVRVFSSHANISATGIIHGWIE